LRKLLKTRRVTRVRQVGTDRVIELQFGDDGQYRMFLEFFAVRYRIHNHLCDPRG
jgi:predicted ribosome quality control (RQC) complex YloA/Tae2 family protein